MDNVLNLKAALAAAAVIFATSAQAQPAGNAQLLAPTTIEAASMDDIAAILAPMRVSVTSMDDGDAATFTMIATAESGGQFLVTLFGCADPGVGSNCQGVSTYAGFSNAGLAYDDLNRYNLESSISKAINVADQNAVIFGVQQFLNGGVSLNNVQFVIALFLTDLDNYMGAGANGKTSVAWTENEADPAASKTGNVLQTRGAPSPAPFGPYSVEGAIASAINNTSDVRFSPPSQP